MMEEIIKTSDLTAVKRDAIIGVSIPEPYGGKDDYYFYFYVKNDVSNMLVSNMFKSKKKAIDWLKTVLPEFADKFVENTKNDKKGGL